jgi:hypothetical protein
MAAPLYVLSGLTTAEVFRDLSHEGDFMRGDMATAVGPGGQNGLLLSAHQPVGALANRSGFEAGQNWVEIVEGRTFVCVNDDPKGKADRVRPVDLQRHPYRRPSFAASSQPAVRGYGVNLCDGQEWCVPLVRSPRRRFGSGLEFDQAADRDATWLPQLVSLNAGGEVERRPMPGTPDLFPEYVDVVQCVFLEALAAVPFKARLDLAVRTLAVNYRLDHRLAGALALFDEDSVNEVLQAAVDYPLLMLFSEESEDRPSPTFFGGGAARLPAD